MEELENNYDRLGILGSGNFASVELVSNKFTGELFAAKLVDLKRAVPSSVKSELKMFEVVKKNPHPNLVTCVECMADKAHVIFIYEYLPMGSLLHWLSLSNPPVSQVVELFFGIVKGICHLHRLGYAHRDLKLENICLSGEGVPKLIDFDFCCKWRANEYIDTYCGSLHYSAPELFLRLPYRGPEVDAWAAGVILFALLFRRFPFDNLPEYVDKNTKNGKDKSMELARIIVSGKYSCPVNCGVPKDVISLLQGLIVIDPVKRTTLLDCQSHPVFDICQKTTSKVEKRRGSERLKRDGKEAQIGEADDSNGKQTKKFFGVLSRRSTSFIDIIKRGRSRTHATPVSLSSS
eukprot:TRINITY_DN455_c0_g1_i5.p1 TRINITY_DN455_c0_g1~~TRINITY_DN455_c0_g1_i5.p1  ORF type:complete len:348 (-),score=76.83 TRINITY_DN455_c0_g1_i5:66-1109(-)